LWIVYKRPPVIAQVGQKIKEKTEILFSGSSSSDDDQPDAYLEVISGDEKGTIIGLQSTGTRLGRDEEYATNIFSDTSVSKLHAEISYDVDGYWIRDEGSANGTWVNDKRVEMMEKRQLQHNDRIKLGRVLLKLAIASKSDKDLTEDMSPIEDEAGESKSDTEPIS